MLTDDRKQEEEPDTQTCGRGAEDGLSCSLVQFGWIKLHVSWSKHETSDPSLLCSGVSDPLLLLLDASAA